MNYLKPVLKYPVAFDKAQFKKAKCLLTISVGQEAHEGDKFAATVELVNDSFGSCIMLVDDTLQRHSMALDKEEGAEFFYNASFLAGDLWLQRNKIYYQRLSILESIIRWDKWLIHPHYNIQQEKMKQLMREDAAYAEAFNKTIEEFLRRYYLRLTQQQGFDWRRAKKLCLDYLIEECTALSLWSELGCAFEVYPNKRNAAMHETHQRLVIPDYPNLLHAIAIKFKNRKQFKPQHFQNTALVKELV